MWYLMMLIVIMLALASMVYMLETSQVVHFSRVASWGPGVVNIHDAAVAMY
jgi:hypothetical protein